MIQIFSLTGLQMYTHFRDDVKISLFHVRQSRDLGTINELENTQFCLAVTLPVGWPSFLPCILKEIISEEFGDLVVFQEFPSLGMLSIAAVKDVEGAVIACGFHVLYVIFHLHLHGVTIIVLPAFELLVPVLAFQALQCPLLLGRPAHLSVQQHHGLVRLFITLHKLLHR